MKKNVPIREYYLRAAIGLIDSELRLLDLRIRFPERFVLAEQPQSASPLYWTATPTELAELLCALDFCGAVHYTDGRKATFTDLVEEVGRLFNIQLGAPYDLKRNVLRRKTRLTVFIDRLRRLLVEYSAKI